MRPEQGSCRGSNSGEREGNVGQCVVREAMVRSREGSGVIDWWRRRAGEGTPRRRGNGARRSGMGEGLARLLALASGARVRCAWWLPRCPPRTRGELARTAVGQRRLGRIGVRRVARVDGGQTAARMSQHKATAMSSSMAMQRAHVSLSSLIGDGARRNQGRFPAGPDGGVGGAATWLARGGRVHLVRRHSVGDVHVCLTAVTAYGRWSIDWREC